MKKWLAWVWVPFVLCTIYRRWPFPELSLIMKFGRMMVSTISALVPEGRPRLLDETAELNLIDTIERRHLANDAVRTSDFMAVYASAATEYYARLGVGKTVFTVSKRTLNWSIQSVIIWAGQTKTGARIKNDSDPRNMLSMRAMFHAYCKDLPPIVIFNWDATQHNTIWSGQRWYYQTG